MKALTFFARVLAAPDSRIFPAFALSALRLAGCGSGGSTVGASGGSAGAVTAASRVKTGSATFTVRWPRKTSVKSAKINQASGKATANGTRYIPVETDAIIVVVTDAQGAVKANDGTNSNTAHISGLAPGTYTVSANATATIEYGAEGSILNPGASISAASAPLVIQSGQDTPISLTLESTIVKIVFNISPSTLILGEPVTFTGPTSYNADGLVVSSGSNFNSGVIDFAPGFTIDYGADLDGDYSTYIHGVSGTLKAYASKVGSEVVTATEESGATAQANITVTEAATMSVTPSEVTISPGGSLPQSFAGIPSLIYQESNSFLATAALNSTPSVQVPVLAAWQVQEGAIGGTIVGQPAVGFTGGGGYSARDYVSGGVYTAGTTPGTYHVVAQNFYDNNFKATAIVHVTTSGPAVTLTPAAPTIGVGSLQAFTAQVASNSVQAVTWSVVEGAAGGSIAANGVYTAPVTPGVYHVQASSSADSRGVGIAAVTVVPTGSAQVILQ